MSHSVQKQLTMYGQLMEEVKVRFQVINLAAQGHTQLAAPFVREFMYLQTRLLCELIALGCLVAHGDIGSLQSHKVGRTFSADEILDRMSKLRPHFYPIAMRETSVVLVDGGPKRNHNLEAIEPSPLPKEDLLSIYAKTHKYLHRGSLKKLLSADAILDMTINVPEIISYIQKMADLLSHHAIPINENKVMLCLLMNPDNNNLVQVIMGDRQGPPIQPNLLASGRS